MIEIEIQGGANLNLKFQRGPSPIWVYFIVRQIYERREEDKYMSALYYVSRCRKNSEYMTYGVISKVNDKPSQLPWSSMLSSPDGKHRIPLESRRCGVTKRGAH